MKKYHEKQEVVETYGVCEFRNVQFFSLHFRHFYPVVHHCFMRKDFLMNFLLWQFKVSSVFWFICRCGNDILTLLIQMLLICAQFRLNLNKLELLKPLHTSSLLFAILLLVDISHSLILNFCSYQFLQTLCI
jgi:hypothetical protein